MVLRPPAVPDVVPVRFPWEETNNSRDFKTTPLALVNPTLSAFKNSHVAWSLSLMKSNENEEKVMKNILPQCNEVAGRADDSSWWKPHVPFYGRSCFCGTDLWWWWGNDLLMVDSAKTFSDGLKAVSHGHYQIWIWFDFKISIFCYFAFRSLS